ncbi:MAG TPA: alpha/beta hydrolase [Actinomycetota bacterium]
MPTESPATSIWDDVALVPTAHGPIEVGRAGDGPCVLVVHGVPGSWRQALTLAADLRDGYRVIAPSRPGYGRTPLSVGRTYDEQADAFAAALDSLGIQRALVVGASGGGPPAAAFAARHPDRTAGLVLACALVAHRLKIPREPRLMTVPVLGEILSAVGRVLAARQLASARVIDRKIASDLTPDEQRRVAADPRIRDDLVAFARTHLDAPPGLAGMRNDLAQIRRAQASRDDVPQISVPTLVLHGTADEVVPLFHGEHYARAIPGATLETYDEAGHIFFVTRRQEASGRIRGFASQVLGGGA